MYRFAANLSMLFTEIPFLDRFRAAKDAGFEGVEFLFPYEWSKQDLKARLDYTGLEQVLFNLPAGNWGKGERGIAALPGRESEFLHSVELALEYADHLNCRKLHIMAGVCPEGETLESCFEVYLANLAYACEQAQAANIMVLIEPLNTRAFPGYLLSHQAQARKIIDHIAMPNLKLQMDLYHAQIMEGDLSVLIRHQMDYVGHIQIAGVPDRHEPSDGEINYGWIFSELLKAKYDGWVGCEYTPKTDTKSGLGWLDTARNIFS
ncbi:hydroxypyruvate isomerase [Kiloniella spongiae]|uniref:Hydroxypyruvate isomerase n=1 Tax=Kiloniella spongiae TaxID=1489064 RepID=A0A0H2MST6_9PROT|nr:2-oxo-tetronate isomerase [Kiloniella spongiae]KLN59715.1 hydroxypyruvate isomerase [Kiloniella spongiae]